MQKLSRTWPDESNNQEGRLKWLGRYLKGELGVAQRFETPLSCDGQCMKIVVDIDNAGDVNTRRPAVGQVAFLGSHVVKHACNLFANRRTIRCRERVLRHFVGVVYRSGMTVTVA